MHRETLEWFSVLIKNGLLIPHQAIYFWQKKRDRKISPLLSRCNIYGSPPVRSAGMPITGPRDIGCQFAQANAENAIISMSLITKAPYSLSPIAVHKP